MLFTADEYGDARRAGLLGYPGYSEARVRTIDGETFYEVSLPDHSQAPAGPATLEYVKAHPQAVADELERMWLLARDYEDMKAEIARLRSLLHLAAHHFEAEGKHAPSS